MRVWFSGPRMFGGLVRPGVSFGPEDWRRYGAAQAAHPRGLQIVERIAWSAILVAALLMLVAAGIFLLGVGYVVIHGA